MVVLILQHCSVRVALHTYIWRETKMKINARKVCLSVALVVVLTVGACMPGLALELKVIPGTFSFGAGFAYATQQTTIWGGSGATTSTGETQTKLSWSADYKYPLSHNLRIGVSLLNWKFDPISSQQAPDGGTSLCAMAGYMLKPDQELYLGMGPDIIRIGGRFYKGDEAKKEKGLFFSAEFDAPLNSNYVDSFGNLGVGYSF